MFTHRAKEGRDRGKCDVLTSDRPTGDPDKTLVNPITGDGKTRYLSDKARPRIPAKVRCLSAQRHVT